MPFDASLMPRILADAKLTDSTAIRFGTCAMG